LELRQTGSELIQPNPNNPGSGNYTTNTIVTIDEEEFGFDYRNVSTVRPDIFKPNHFSMFDILVHLSQQGKIDLMYHWDDSMNTHVVDHINNKTNWWYRVKYSGGWWEYNAFRMDHYPWKQDTALLFYQAGEDYIKNLYKAFREEIERKESNNGQVIIPSVRIRYTIEIYWEFYNVSVTAHNLRNDTFQNDVITALDVIMSLGDEGNITYSLQWYDALGAADVVRSYWVEMLNGVEAFDTCGWVYESGSSELGTYRNHIHLPSDVRILNSPEYNLWFWICL
jgi:hypothetical protein